MKKRKQHPPTYLDGELTLYDIIDRADDENPDFPVKMIKLRDIDPIPYRDLSVYDRTRLVFEQAGKTITHKLAIPTHWTGIDTDCVCMLSEVNKVGETDTNQYKVFNCAFVWRDGYAETELTLEMPEAAYEVSES